MIQGMENLIRQAFLHVDVIGPHVAEGHYDLIGSNNEIILPGVWELVIEPDSFITMHMWPIPEAVPQSTSAAKSHDSVPTPLKSGEHATVRTSISYPVLDIAS